jgi:formate dehydrogenase subunit gamma
MQARARSLVALLLIIALSGLTGAPPPAAAQTTPVNPTELSVQEEALLDALTSGEAVAGRVSIPNPRAADLIKPSGRDWSELQSGALVAISLWSLVGVLVLLALFYLVRGRIRVESGMSGRRIKRFGGLERFAHWLTAVPFVVLALTGLNVVLGRTLLLPLIGPEAFGTFSAYAKLAHNFLAWPFMLGVLLVFLIWVKDNFPSRVDGEWLAEGGGLLGKGKHPPARKFNAGQKLIFWSVVLGGVAMSVTGFFLIFPQFAGPSANWQQAQVIHGLVAAALTVVILAHIYIGSIGMEGAFSAMGTGDVDLNWAKEHHALWVDKQIASGAVGLPSKGGRVAPAE